MGLYLGEELLLQDNPAGGGGVSVRNDCMAPKEKRTVLEGKQEN